MTLPLAREQERLLACVHCGFCLTACPTYTRLGDEADSPRGRLHLMRAVAEGRLEPGSDAFRTHIDRCLGCRACEPVCPSGVQYGFLLERARQVAATAGGRRRSNRLLLATMANRALLALFSVSGRVLRATGIARLATRVLPARFGQARTAAAMLAATSPWRGLQSAGIASARGVNGRHAPGPEHVRAPTTGQNREVAEPHARYGGLREGTAVLDSPASSVAQSEKVAILHGCVQSALYARVNRATIDVLRANGCDVVDAPDQGCCGALHAHAGDMDTALALARRMIASFEASGAGLIIVNAAGCGAMLKEYGEQFEHDEEMRERAVSFSSRVRDVSEFLCALGPRTGGEVPLRVTFDAPCHLIHAQRIARDPLDVLATVPGLEIVPLPGAEECCGGAGTYGLEHPELGGRILADKLHAIRTTGAQVVLTPNPGCMMQIGAGLLLRGEDVPVLHPMEILAESYRRAATAGGRDPRAR
jgi:glycolate oxidase iron-sulfur subunit